MFCPVCGAENPPDTNECARCGALLPEEKARAPVNAAYTDTIAVTPVAAPITVPAAEPSPAPASGAPVVVRTPTTFAERLREKVTIPAIVGSVLFVLGVFFWFQGYFVAYNYLTGILLIDDTYPVRFFYLVLIFVLGWFLLAMSRRLIVASAVRGVVLAVLGLVAIVVCFISSVYLLVVSYEMVMYLFLLMSFSTYMAVLGVVSLWEGFREYSKIPRKGTRAADSDLWSRLQGTD